jgi:hypothetical protein
MKPRLTSFKIWMFGAIMFASNPREDTSFIVVFMLTSISLIKKLNITIIRARWCLVKRLMA